MSSSENLAQNALDQISNGLNKALVSDPTSHQLLLSIEGRSAKIEITDLSLSIYVLFTENGIRLQQLAEATSEVLVEAGLMQFLRAAKTGNPRGLSIEGDAELAQVMAQIAHRLPASTWESISKKIGDGPSRVVEKAVQNLSALIERTRKQLEYQVVEYLHYETQMLPSKEEVSNFYDEVRSLSNDLERLRKRVDILDRSK